MGDAESKRLLQLCRYIYGLPYGAQVHVQDNGPVKAGQRVATWDPHNHPVIAEVSGEAEFVVLPGVMGELGIYPRHTPLFTEIRPGAVRMKLPNQEREELVFVQGGYLEVQPHHVTVLADTAIRAKDLDEVAALEAKKAAEEAMQNKTSKEEIAQAEAELSSALAQLEAIRKLRHRA